MFFLFLLMEKTMETSDKVGFGELPHPKLQATVVHITGFQCFTIKDLDSKLSIVSEHKLINNRKNLLSNYQQFLDVFQCYSQQENFENLTILAQYLSHNQSILNHTFKTKILGTARITSSFQFGRVKHWYSLFLKNHTVSKNVS